MRKLNIKNALIRKDGLGEYNIKIEDSSNRCNGYDREDSDGYIVSILNLDQPHPVWGRQDRTLFEGQLFQEEFRRWRCHWRSAAGAAGVAEGES